MDLSAFYQKIRDVEAEILHDFAVVVSHKTADGGKEGVKTEVPRRVAARMVVGGLARLASEEEARLFQAAVSEAQRVAEKIAAAAKVQFAVVTSSEIERLNAKAEAK